MDATPIIEILGERFALIPEAEYLKLRGTVEGSASLTAGLWGESDLVDADDYTAKVIGQNLRAARNAVSLTQDQLGRKLKKSQAMVSASERGKTEVGLRYWEQVLKACGLPANWSPRDQALTPGKPSLAKRV